MYTPDGYNVWVAHDAPDALIPTSWFTLPEHPRGAGDLPYFDVLGSMVYPSTGHPDGPSAAPWYQLRDVLAFAVDGHPGGPSVQPDFLMRDRFVYPMPEGFDGGVAWFRVENQPGSSAVGA
jgi:hypothetical protein